MKIACLEEISWRKQWIDDDQLMTLTTGMNGTGYGRYLLSLLDRH